MEERRKASWISAAVTVNGTVASTTDLVIDGKVEGAIELGDHNLTIGEAATVVADLMAKHVTISGKVKGNVVGAATVALKKSAEVEGDITAPKFAMEDGAVLSGRVETGKSQ